MRRRLTLNRIGPALPNNVISSVPGSRPLRMCQCTDPGYPVRFLFSRTESPARTHADSIRRSARESGRTSAIRTVDRPFPYEVVCNLRTAQTRPREGAPLKRRVLPTQYSTVVEPDVYKMLASRRSYTRLAVLVLHPKQRVGGSSPLSRSGSIKSMLPAISPRQKSPKKQMLTPERTSRLP